jgi:hypothetical protein
MFIFTCYKKAQQNLVGKPKGKRPFRICKGREKDNIKLYLQRVEHEGMKWIRLAQNRDQWRHLVNTAMKLRLL